MTQGTLKSGQRVKVLGVDLDHTDCECCGKTNLKLTVMLGRLDCDGTVVEVLRFGRDCAARATLIRRTGAAMEAVATEAQREAEAAERNRVVDLGMPIDFGDPGAKQPVWVVESVGQNGGSVTRLCLATNARRSQVEAWAAKQYPASVINVRKAI